MKVSRTTVFENEHIELANDSRGKPWKRQQDGEWQKANPYDLVRLPGVRRFWSCENGSWEIVGPEDI